MSRKKQNEMQIKKIYNKQKKVIKEKKITKKFWDNKDVEMIRFHIIHLQSQF